MATGPHGGLMHPDEQFDFDDDDVIGAAPKPGKKRGRKSNAEKAELERVRQEEIERGLIASMQTKKGAPALGDPYLIHNGVNVTWLCQAFRQDVKTVRRKLAGIEPIGIGPRNVEVYDFATAASYLAKPPPDQLASFLHGLRVSDLPIQLQDPYWSAMRKRQIYMENAGDSWRTEKVQDVLAEAFKAIKTSTQLWVDSVESQAELTDEQRVALGRLVDLLLEDMAKRLIEMPSLRQTGSMATDPEAHPELAQGKSQARAQADEDEDLVG